MSLFWLPETLDPNIMSISYIQRLSGEKHDRKRTNIRTEHRELLDVNFESSPNLGKCICVFYTGFFRRGTSSMAIMGDFAPWFLIVMRLKRLVWPVPRIRHFYSSPGQLSWSSHLSHLFLFWYYYVCSIETVLNYLTLFQYYMCSIKMWCLSTAHVVLKYFNTGLLLNLSYYINVIIRRFSDYKWQMTSYKKCIGQISTMPLKDTFLTFIQH